MREASFERLLELVKDLTGAQRRILARTLESIRTPEQALEIINARAGRCHLCPSCGSPAAQRWGVRAGVQRYRCTACGRTYNALSGTPLARLKRRDVWLDYLDAVRQGLSVRKAAAAAGIHRTTSFRWRHRMLTGPRTCRDTELDGIVEADETYFLRSYKGSRSVPRTSRRRGGTAEKRGLSREQVPVLLVRDRAGHHFDAMLEAADTKHIGVILPQLLSDQSVLCSDGANVYRGIARDFDIAHEGLNHSKGNRLKERVFHIQNVNAYGSRLKNWMQRFNGVATKYLPNYLGWRRMLDKHGDNIPPPTILAMALEGYQP